MAKQYQIKWKRGDLIKLGQAVSNFNKKINKLETEENKLYLPDTLSFKELKETIQTRQELNRQINSLKRFMNEDSTTKIILDSGAEITKWEYGELKKERKRAISRLKSELAEEIEQNKNYRAGFTTAKQGIIEDTLVSLNKLTKTTGYEFKRVKERIHRQGRSDYSFWRQSIYRENYYKALEGIKNFKNYNILRAKLDSIKNPNQFYEYIQKNDTLSDLFLYYRNGDGLVYGSFATNEEAFDTALEDLGLI